MQRVTMRRTDDAILVVCAMLHGAAVLAVPAAPVIAVGVWWSSNTIGHNFIHRPFFQARALNRMFSAYQSVVTGIPQTLWRDRHIAHHRGVPWEGRWSGQLLVELALIAGLWALLAASDLTFFAAVYLPGYVAGLALCGLQGHYEHAGGTTSHYGRIYNLLCFNDGYHVEHHAHPGVPWAELPPRAAAGARSSPWPPLLRWLGIVDLEGLERLVLRSRLLQQVVLAVHKRALRNLLDDVASLRRVAIVGGGLFPRTALALLSLRPETELVIIDDNRNNLETARAFMNGRSNRARHELVDFRHARFTPDEEMREFDLVVIPLSFHGDRNEVYARPPAHLVLVHDWLWRSRGRSRVVSTLLLKRLNLVQS